MASDLPPPALRRPPWRALAEIALIFAVFFIYGAYPVPDVNEPYYLGKAIHFWNPAWIRGDFFLDSRDSHQVFYFAVGWLSIWLSPTALAWVVRVVTWLLLAWSWQRLSFVAVPRRWFSILTAALFVALVRHFNLAGEWVVGGAEAKGLSYSLVFFGLAAVLQDRWNRAWLWFGAAAAMHVLVGGWACVAAGLAWFMSTCWPSPRAHLPAGERGVGRRIGCHWLCQCLSAYRHKQALAKPVAPSTDDPSPATWQTTSLRSMLPGLLGGFLLSLPGLVPALLLNWGTNPAVVREANQIYVFERFFHHLSPGSFSEVFIFRFLLLCVFWLLLCEIMPVETALRRLRAFIFGALGIALVGVAISFLPAVDPALAAGLLRFYWFRLTDVAVPLGVALTGMATIAAAVRRQPSPPAPLPDGKGRSVGKRWLAGAVAVVAVLLTVEGVDRVTPQPPRAAPPDRYWAWREACEWVVTSGRIPPDACFLTPRVSQTFKWYANRSEVVNWKESPQDAQGIVEWWRRLKEIHGADSDDPRYEWYGSLAELGAPRLQELGAKYHATYAITEARWFRLPLEVVYENEAYIIYRLSQ